MSALITTTRKIVDLRQAAIDILKQIEELQAAQIDTYQRYLYDLDTNTPAADYSRQIADLHDQLDLIISEYRDRRRI